MSVSGQNNQKPQLVLVSEANSDALSKKAGEQKSSASELKFTPEKLARYRTSSKVLKAESIHPTLSPVLREPSVNDFRGDKNKQPLPLASESSHAALQAFQENLKSFNDLHARLRFMLNELEEFIHD